MKRLLMALLVLGAMTVATTSTAKADHRCYNYGYRSYYRPPVHAFYPSYRSYYRPTYYHGHHHHHHLYHGGHLGIHGSRFSFHFGF